MHPRLNAGFCAIGSPPNDDNLLVLEKGDGLGGACDFWT